MTLPISLSFTSFTYLALLFAAAGISVLLPRKLLPLWLLTLSVGYYIALAPAALPILAAATVLIYLLALQKNRRVWTGIGVCALLTLLAVCKYLPPLWRSLTGTRLAILLPLGISYYVFSGISYLVDVKREKLPPCRSFLDLSLYLLYFPKLTAGPIERPVPFFAAVDRLREGNDPRTAESTRAGLLLLLSGFLRKIAVADVLAAVVSRVYDAPAGKSGFAVAGATLCYTLQIYADFAGYTDIARGSSLLFGIPLTENFDHPYLAESVKDFWRRWHISLSLWLRDYLYIPLGGNRKGTARRRLNLLLTFLGSGIWHGAGPTFIIWGLYHGLMQLAEELLPWREKWKEKCTTRRLLFRIPATVITFLVVAVGWMPFRAASVGDLGILLRAYLTPGSLADAWTLLAVPVGQLLLLAAALVASDRLKKEIDRDRDSRTALLFLAVAAFLLLLLAAGNGGGSAFIYFEF